jgi:hypothetical protein
MLHGIGAKPNEHISTRPNMKALHAKLRELNPRWKEVPHPEMVTDHTCLKLLSSHLSKWAADLDAVTVYYYAVHPDATDSEEEEEPAHASASHPFYRPANDRVMLGTPMPPDQTASAYQ